ncbi:MAG TPA: ferritin-like domain-containing protein [Polyangiaceae bacterium]|nr:ferritin-like domain-containing protein [Polyangiaceae bacterium]
MRLDARRRHTLAKHILIALGLSPAAACGGTAVVDGNQGSGGAGSNPSSNATGNVTTTTTSNVTTSTGSGGFTCDVELPLNSELVYACLSETSPVCPPKENFSVMSSLDAQLSGACTDPDTCWCWDQNDEFCSCYKHVTMVPCGPDPSAESGCCYYAIVTTDLLCEGRPFVIEGVACTALPETREDWMVRLTPRLDDLDADTRRALADAWTEDALAEHASVASFARFVLELLAVSAPADLVRDAQRALADEIAHAEISFGLASAYAGAPVGPGPLAMPTNQLRSHLAEIAAATAREGCINETLAALCAQAAHDDARDEVVKTALHAIARDEARHAALAWRFVAWAVRRDPSARAAVEEVFASALPPSEPAKGMSPPGLANHGQLSPSRRAQIIRGGFDSVVIPCAYELLADAKSAEIAAGRAGV